MHLKVNVPGVLEAFPAVIQGIAAAPWANESFPGQETRAFPDICPEWP